VAFYSGGNTTLNGAQIDGKTVTGFVGGHLDITSLQNSQYYNSSSSSSGFSASYGGGIGSASFTNSKSNLNSNYLSVADQSGIFAGSGGYNLTVKGNSNLAGGVISSTANPALNSFTTGTLTYGNIQNSASYGSEPRNVGQA
jgi:filamentous hemagglutinin